MIPNNPVSEDALFEDDAFAASQSLQDELLGMGYMTSMGPSLGSSLAAELQSANGHPEHADHQSNPERLPPNAIRNDLHRRTSTASVELQSLAVGDVARNGYEWSNGKRSPFDVDDGHTSPLHPPWSSTANASNGNLYAVSRRSSFASTWSSSLDTEDDDPFEMLKRQLEELNTTVWETKTLHKRLFNTILSDETLQLRGSSSHTARQSFSPPLELVVTAVINQVEAKSRDRERQTSYLSNVNSTLRKESSWMTTEVIRDLENLVQSMKATLHDSTFAYENPLPALHTLKVETEDMASSLEELKELMYVNKHQVQELNSRLRSITKTVHEVRKDFRRINKFLEDKDDDETVVLEKGEVAERVKDILWGLDDLDAESSRQLERMQTIWRETTAATLS